MTIKCTKCSKRPVTLEAQPAVSEDYQSNLWSPMCEACLRQLIGEYPVKIKRVGTK